jgi:hypothetical protein
LFEGAFAAKIKFADSCPVDAGNFTAPAIGSIQAGGSISGGTISGAFRSIE